MKGINIMKKIISVLMILTLIFAFAACGKNNGGETKTTAPANATNSATTDGDIVETIEAKGTVIGSYDPGEIGIYVTIINKAQEEKLFTVYTDKTTLGPALKDKGLIDGEMGEYGLTVKTVNGETHNYETEGYAWMVYVGDKQAETGVDSITLENGASYTFKVETF